MRMRRETAACQGAAPRGNIYCAAERNTERRHMGTRIIRTDSAEETRRAAALMGKEAFPGEVLALIGDLGTGKTVFTQGFAEGLGITGPVTSPTFTIMQVYDEGRLQLAHFDVYRIADPDEMDEIGYEDYFYGDGVCLVEWADLISDLLPEGTVKVTIRKVPGENPDLWIIEIDKDAGTDI